ncbi:hypothetical protein [Sphingomonas prati]|uniref:Uncharacterized protein n=1 Tax=Sphingomonas prati TaxID=1843237 RepID=A0A7W9F1I4_9SPHN|nr:hypothetical protein [Sphingomonas prati]MBB5729348.1 hypothetical protein [Sphingomonas prati]GGE78191.1 hypothetical protein GCM10011404_08540 [Sphingomonas prati]
MAAWHRSKQADIGLRLAGLASWGVAYASFNLLQAVAKPTLHGPTAFLAIALAATLFLCASSGAALITLGNHLLDRITVSGRWQRLPRVPIEPVPLPTAQPRPQQHRHLARALHR